MILNSDVQAGKSGVAVEIMVLTWLQREPSRILTEYLTSGDFVEAALRELGQQFRQMGMYVVLTEYLF
jgi:hypothetical protein